MKNLVVVGYFSVVVDNYVPILQDDSFFIYYWICHFCGDHYYVSQITE